MTLSTEICRDLKRANKIKNVVIAALIVTGAIIVVSKNRTNTVANVKSDGR